MFFNRHPARVFMGDTGSMALGGAVAAVAALTHSELFLLLLGGVYVLEGLSVILQVVSFQTTGKRILLMAPLHHHFELKGWPERKVVRFLGLITGFCFSWIARLSKYRIGSAYHNVYRSKVLVVGLARSGLAAAQSLHKHGAQVIGYDQKAIDSLGTVVRDLEQMGIPVINEWEPEGIKPIDLIVISPGVPLSLPMCQWAQAEDTNYWRIGDSF